ncbi:hypothetical protein ACQ4LE_006797 [Meloidogyne hapla]
MASIPPPTLLHQHLSFLIRIPTVIKRFSSEYLFNFIFLKSFLFNFRLKTAVRRRFVLKFLLNLQLLFLSQRMVLLMERAKRQFQLPAQVILLGNKHNIFESSG